MEASNTAPDLGQGPEDRRTPPEPFPCSVESAGTQPSLLSSPGLDNNLQQQVSSNRSPRNGFTAWYCRRRSPGALEPFDSVAVRKNQLPPVSHPNVVGAWLAQSMQAAHPQGYRMAPAPVLTPPPPFAQPLHHPLPAPHIQPTTEGGHLLQVTPPFPQFRHQTSRQQLRNHTVGRLARPRPPPIQPANEMSRQHPKYRVIADFEADWR